MPRIEWDKRGERFYETGTDRGVLYPKNQKGVPWNGLTSVERGRTRGENASHYVDGYKHHNEIAPEDYQGTIKAWTYPDEFSHMAGDYTTGQGIYYGQQDHPSFGLSYRTLIGDDTNGQNYKIHLVYDAKASPGNVTHGTISDSPSPSEMSWVITTKPIIISAKKPMSELIIDSRESDPSKLRQLENILYGIGLSDARLPSPQEVIDLFDDWAVLEIVPDPVGGLSQLKFLGLPDLKGDTYRGLYTKPSDSRLRETTQFGLYTIG